MTTMDHKMVNPMKIRVGNATRLGQRDSSGSEGGTNTVK